MTGEPGRDVSVPATIDHLRRQGFSVDFAVTPDGCLQCGECGHVHSPREAQIVETFRFEGPSNPDDQAIVYGLVCEKCGVRGVLVAAYGPSATAEEAAVVTALVPRS